MRKFQSNFIFILLYYTFFVVSTIITLFIVYKDIENTYSFIFVIGYAIFLVLSLFYFIIATIINMKKFKWNGLGKRMLRFITSFVLLSGTSIILYTFFKSAEIDYYRTFSIALGLSLGMSFFDLVFAGKRSVD